MKTNVKFISFIMAILLSGQLQASMLQGSDWDRDRWRAFSQLPADPDQKAILAEKTGSVNENEELLDETAPARGCGKPDAICVGTYALGVFLLGCLGVIVLGVVECTTGGPFPVSGNCTGGFIPWGIP